MRYSFGKKDLRRAGCKSHSQFRLTRCQICPRIFEHPRSILKAIIQQVKLRDLLIQILVGWGLDNDVVPTEVAIVFVGHFRTAVPN